MDARAVERLLTDFADSADEDEMPFGDNGWEFWNDDGGAWLYMADPPERFYSRFREQWVDTYSRREIVPVPGLGNVKLVESFGGEGQGDQYYIILSVEMLPVVGSDSETRYFKVDGFYASHYGGELDGPMYEVTPVQKTITVYERK